MTDATRVMRELVDEGVLSTEQAQEVSRRLAGAPPSAGSVAWLAEAAGYLGAGLVFGAVLWFAGASWEDLGRVARCGLLAACTLALFLTGLLVAGGPAALRQVGGVRRRLAGVLLAAAAVPAAFAVGIAVRQYPELSGLTFGLVVAAAGLLLVPTALGVAGTAVLSGYAVWELNEDLLGGSSAGATVLLIVLGAAWAALSALNLLPAPRLGFAAGAACAVLGAQQPLLADHPTLAYPLTLAVAAGCVVLYRRRPTAVLLVAGVLTATLAVVEALVDWTDGALHGSVLLLLTGATLITASAVGVHLRRTNPSTPA